ncbi:unnamed protein product, partial [Urochloa humidicola]
RTVQRHAGEQCSGDAPPPPYARAPSSHPVPSSRSSWVFRPVVSRQTLWHLLRPTAPASAEIKLGIRSWYPSPEVCERPLLGRGMCLQRWGLGNIINWIRNLEVVSTVRLGI